MSEEQLQINDTIFFFGAGISVLAGVPTTFDFVKQYERNLADNDSELLSKFTEIKNLIQSNEISGKAKHEEPDIEMVYEFLNRISNHRNELITVAFPDYDYTIKELDPETITLLIDDLKEFIKSKTHVAVEKTLYLNDLRKFFKSNMSYDIYTTNYDNVIEQFCFFYNIDYSDGFELFYDIRNFQKSNLQLRIYKIHGSLGWYQTSLGRFVKIPLILEKNQRKLFTEETLDDMIMYPMQKWERPGPLLDLIYSLKTKLNSLETKLVITSGYSFRDEYLRLLFIEALKSNRNLSLVIISPSASGSKIRLVRDAQTELKDRVIIYPARFEHILENLSDFSSYLKQGVDLEKKCINDEIIQGYSGNWNTTLYYFEKSLHFEKIFSILTEKISQINELNFENLIKLNLISAIGLFSIDSDIKALKALIMIRELLYKLVEIIQIKVLPKEDSGQLISYTMNYKYSLNGSFRTASISFHSINMIFEALHKLEFIRNLALQKEANDNKWKKILDLFEFSKELQQYFSFWSDGELKDFEEINKRYRILDIGFEEQLLTSQNLDQKIKEKEELLLKNIISKTFEKYDFSELEVDTFKSTAFFQALKKYERNL